MNADADTAKIIGSLAAAISQVAGVLLTVRKSRIEKDDVKTQEAGLWLYEMRVVNEQMVFNLIMQWPPERTR